MTGTKIAVPLREAAQLVSLSEDYIRDAVHRTKGNRLPARFIGKRKYLVHVDDLSAWIKKEGEGT